MQDVAGGSEVRCYGLREGKKLDLKLEIADRAELNAALESGARPGRPRRRKPAPEAESAAGSASAYPYRSLTPDDKQELNFSGKTGILVTRVDAGSFAEDIGLRAGGHPHPHEPAANPVHRRFETAAERV